MYNSGRREDLYHCRRLIRLLATVIYYCTHFRILLHSLLYVRMQYLKKGYDFEFLADLVLLQCKIFMFFHFYFFPPILRDRKNELCKQQLSKCWTYIKYNIRLHHYTVNIRLECRYVTVLNLILFVRRLKS